MLGRQDPQIDLADAVLVDGEDRPQPLVEKGSFHDRFAAVRATMLRDEDFEHWFDAEQGRRSIPPSVVAGGVPAALREGFSDREAEQRTRYDLRSTWALGLGPNDHGCDHSGLCVFRARLLAHQEEGRLFPEIVSRGQSRLAADQALGAGDGQLADAGGGGGAGHGYKLIRTVLHKLVKGH